MKIVDAGQMPSRPDHSISSIPASAVDHGRLAGGRRLGWTLLVSVACQLLVCGCITSSQPRELDALGISPGYEAFIPAKVVVFPCQYWPVPPTAGTDIFCRDLDAYILASFGNQPYMSGYPPATLARIIEKPEDADWTKIWNQTAGSTPLQSMDEAQGRLSLMRYYRTSQAPQTEWLSWLGRISELTNYTDAVLLPVVDELTETRVVDRGVHVTERTAAATLLLIDSNNGQLIWSGRTVSQAARKDLKEQPEPAPWEELVKNLLIESLWKAYPGRVQDPRERTPE